MLVLSTFPLEFKKTSKTNIHPAFYKHKAYKHYRGWDLGLTFSVSQELRSEKYFYISKERACSK